MEGGGPLLDAHQAATDQGLQGGQGQILLAQFDQGKLVAIGGQLGQDGLLLLGQLGQASLGNEDGKALSAARIALGGDSFAGDPFFAQQAGKNGQRGRGGGTQGRCLDRLALGQPLQDAALHVLLFRRELAAAFGNTGAPWAAGRGERRIAVQTVCQFVAAQGGDAVVDGAADLGHQRQHAAQHLAERS